MEDTTKPEVSQKTETYMYWYYNDKLFIVFRDVSLSIYTVVT